ncbi:MAG TPA: hypothetical protein VGI10_02020 [Polyangiaceae bacterium]|jgi:hypothetical protein
MSRAKITSLMLLGTLVACSNEPQPEFASSANETSYAERYPAELQNTRAAYASDEQSARQLFDGFAKYPAEIGTAKHDAVLGMVQRADAAGKSATYSKQMTENQSVARFYADEKDVLAQKVGGAAQYVVKQKPCDVEVYGPTVGALDRSMTKLPEERLRGHDEAHRFIEDHEDALGKPNLEKLQREADEISLASYLVHVQSKMTRRDLARRVNDAGDVKKTLDRSEAEANAVLADASASKSAKTTAQARISTAQAARTSLDNEVAQAKSAIAEMDKRTPQLESDYQKALDALENELKKP